MIAQVMGSVTVSRWFPPGPVYGGSRRRRGNGAASGHIVAKSARNLFRSSDWVLRGGAHFSNMGEFDILSLMDFYNVGIRV